MKVSVVCPNHGRDISKLKASLIMSDYPSELVEIDRGMERSVQRNIGIKEATGDIILWLDSDQSVSPKLIRECVELIQCGISAVYIPEVIVAKSFFGKIRAFERTFYTGTAIDVPRAVLKKVCPMFNTELNGPEDADFGRRIPGIKVVSRNVLYHHDDISFLEYCRKKAYYTKSMRRYAELNPDDPCLKLSYRCWTVFVENRKLLRLLRHPILTIGIIFLLAVRGAIYYANKS